MSEAAAIARAEALMAEGKTAEAAWLTETLVERAASRGTWRWPRTPAP